MDKWAKCAFLRVVGGVSIYIYMYIYTCTYVLFYMYTHTSVHINNSLVGPGLRGLLEAHQRQPLAGHAQGHLHCHLRSLSPQRPPSRDPSYPPIEAVLPSHRGAVREFPKSQGPQCRPQILGLSLQGHPQKGPPIHRPFVGVLGEARGSSSPKYPNRSSQLV